MEKLIIRFEHENGSSEVSFEEKELSSNELFWSWFMASWSSLGLTFVRNGIEENE